MQSDDKANFLFVAFLLLVLFQSLHVGNPKGLPKKENFEITVQRVHQKYHKNNLNGTPDH